VTSSAKNRAAQSNLRNALTAVQSYEAGNQTYSGLNVSVLSTREPSLSWTTGTITTPVSNQVSLDVGSGGNTVILAAEASDGVCYGILTFNGAASSSGLDSNITTAGTYYTGVTNSSSSCSASGLDTLTVSATPTEDDWSTAGFPPGLT